MRPEAFERVDDTLHAQSQEIVESCEFERIDGEGGYAASGLARSFERIDDDDHLASAAFHGSRCPARAFSLKPGLWARCAGLQAHTELNGKLCLCVSHVASTGRWRVQLEDGHTRSIRAANLERLPAGAAAEVDALALYTCKHPGGDTSDLLHHEIRVDARQQMCGLPVRILDNMAAGARPELSGRSACLAEYLPRLRKWRVHVDSGEEVLLDGASLAPLQWTR